MPKLKLNGLKKKMIEQIIDKEKTKIGIARHIDIYWQKFSGYKIGRAEVVGFISIHDKGKGIHISDKTNRYCDVTRIVRHELYHLKHDLMRRFIDGFPRPVWDILHRLFVELPAYLYSDFNENRTAELCRRCPKNNWLDKRPRIRQILTKRGI